ncbi:peptidoglycan-binding protein [Streptomyces sp. NPDC020379]|uniref:peptidoglycan-binding protein n=1 Tax=Streptomyces sp. NPDC020379 TaxID=3365071 RepID=UPI0037BDF15B
MSGAREFISVAREEIGYREGFSDGHWDNDNKFGRWYGMNEEAWCGMFVSWAADRSGNGDIVPRYAWCPAGVEWFQDRGRWSAYPAVGSVVFFGPGGGSHTGICIAYTDDEITTIEGNTNDSGSAEGDGVYLKTRPRKSSYVYGYGIPDFPEGAVVADPDWRGRPGVVHFGEQADESDIPAGGDTSSRPADREEDKEEGRDGGTPERGDSSRQVVIDGLAYGPGSSGEHITRLGEALVRAGCGAYKEGPGPEWTEADTESMRRYQEKIGDTGADADGIPGPRQLARLTAEYGRARTVTVREGDTLSSIAAANDVPLSELTAANTQIADPDTITPGEAVTLP